jgi:hypothetical protein
MPVKTLTAFEIERRRRIYAIVKDNPGIVCKNVAKLADISSAHANAALRCFCDLGFVRITGYGKDPNPSCSKSRNARLANYEVIADLDESKYHKYADAMVEAYKRKRTKGDYCPDPAHDREPEGRLKIVDKGPGHQIIKFGREYKSGSGQTICHLLRRGISSMEY